MTREDIIRMAREADEGFETDTFHAESLVGMDAIERFAHLVYESVFRDANIAASRTILDAAVLEEREACAKFLERGVDMAGLAGDPVMQKYTVELLLGCAAAVRARSNP